MNYLASDPTLRNPPILREAYASMPTNDNTTMSNNETRLNWKRWLNYPSLVRQLPFILYLTGLGVLYIYNGHWANKTIRQTQLAEKQMRELQYEYIAAKGELLARSKPSEVIHAVAPLGLKQLTSSPVVLADSTTPKTERSN
jgi:hypothetical protein